MIFYFSGVGNSRWVAEQLARQLGERLVFIPEARVSETTYELSEGERLGFVFPTYAWGVPSFVEAFIRHLQVKNVGYVYMVTTCGDDTGQTYEIFCHAVGQRGWRCAAAWAVQMPESYICLPGFDVDSPEKERRKHDQARERIAHIVAALQARATGIADTLPGRLAWVKSHIVRPFFNRFLISPRPFKATDACIGCGRCEQVCPYHNIQMKQNPSSSRSLPSGEGLGGARPEWGSDCVLCLRCYHSCPVHALHWGAMTKNKGQYLYHGGQ